MRLVSSADRRQTQHPRLSSQGRTRSALRTSECVAVGRLRSVFGCRHDVSRRHGPPHDVYIAASAQSADAEVVHQLVDLDDCLTKTLRRRKGRCHWICRRRRSAGGWRRASGTCGSDGSGAAPFGVWTGAADRRPARNRAAAICVIQSWVVRARGRRCNWHNRPASRYCQRRQRSVLSGRQPPNQPVGRQGLLGRRRKKALYKLSADRYIYATTGAAAQNLLFVDNDRPGVLSGRAVGRLLACHGIRVGERPLVVGRRIRRFAGCGAATQWSDGDDDRRRDEKITRALGGSWVEGRKFATCVAFIGR